MLLKIHNLKIFDNFIEEDTMEADFFEDVQAAEDVPAPAEGAAAAESVAKAEKLPLGKRIHDSRFARNFRKNWTYLLFLIPAVVVTFIFAYIPMYGLLIAFQDFVPGDSIMDGYWIGFDNFTEFFQNYAFWDLMGNTFILCILGFIIGFPLPIIVAVMLHTTKNKKLSKFLQTIFNGPHFISLVVLVGMLYLFFGRYGLVNNIVANLGGERVSYFLSAKAFRPMYILSSNWQDFGWSSIIYLAALSGVDEAQHEAAKIDGASRVQRILHVDLPAIMPIISVMLIMSIGGLMGVGYEKVLLMQTSGNMDTSEIIATYVYTQGLVKGRAGFATAIGLFNSVINLLLLIIANTTSKRFSENSLF